MNKQPPTCRDVHFQTAGLPPDSDIPVRLSIANNRVPDSGLGPLESLMIDPGITEIQVFSPDSIFIVKNGAIVPVEEKFDDGRHLREVMHRLIAPQTLSDEIPLIVGELFKHGQITASITRVGFRPLIWIRLT